MDALFNWVSEIARSSEPQRWAMAVVILVATGVVAHFAVKFVRTLTSHDGIPLPNSSILVNITRFAVWILGIALMLSSCFDVDVNALLAALGISGLAVSLGMQDTLKNLIAGLQVTMMKIVEPGDHVSIGGSEGIVLDVNWRHTTVKDYENNIHVIPNAIINSTEVEKISPSKLVSTMISFTNDTRDIDALISEMEAVAKRAIEEVAELEKDPWILLTQIGEYGTWAKMRFVLKDTTNAREARDAALRAITTYTRINASEILHDSGEDD